MSNNKKNANVINIILAKASWCPHCVDFTPIYEKTRGKIRPSDVDNCEINLKSYSLDNASEETKFKNEYPGLIEFLQGYPTVIFHMQENNSRPIIKFVEHTVSKGKGEKEIDDAVNEFVNNIKNMYKSIKSDNRTAHVGVRGGGILLEDNEKYRHKYLKYKSKYLKLKNN